jgi:hypothetical protein
MLRPAADDETSVRETTSKADVELLPLIVVVCVQLWTLRGLLESNRLTDFECATFKVNPDGDVKTKLPP